MSGRCSGGGGEGGAAGRGAQGRGRNTAYAHIVPLALFIGSLLVLEVPGLVIEHPGQPWYRHSPEQWLYPLQTVVCLAVLAFYWRCYGFRPVRGLGLAVVLGLAAIAVWILPSLVYGWLGIDDPDGETWWRWIGVADRGGDGFDPGLWAGDPPAYWAAVGMRFVRLVVVVPLVEEIFWRGFLMRWLVDTDRPFTETPFGAWTWPAVLGTTGAFMLAHAPVDWLGAAVFGLAMAWLAVRTRSLAACVVMHAVANLALGLYVMATRTWGFW